MQLHPSTLNWQVQHKLSLFSFNRGNKNRNVFLQDLLAMSSVTGCVSCREVWEHLSGTLQVWERLCGAISGIWRMEALVFQHLKTLESWPIQCWKSWIVTITKKNCADSAIKSTGLLQSYKSITIMPVSHLFNSLHSGCGCMSTIIIGPNIFQ